MSLSPNSGSVTKRGMDIGMDMKSVRNFYGRLFCDRFQIHVSAADVLIGLEDRTIANLDRQMWAYLALQGLDLTYHVYGHLVDDDGTIVGLVQEPHVGRLMQYRDRSIVYDAYSRLQQRGLIYCGAPDFCNTHIMDGKVRFTVLYTIWHFPDKEKCQFQANLRHWKSLQGYFKNLKNTQDVPARQCLNRIWDRVPQLLPCFGPVPFKLSPLNLVVEEPEARYRDIRAWLRKTEHSRKRLAVLDQAMPLAQGGVVRRERIHRIDESWALDSRDMPRSRRRDALTSSYEVELLEHGSHLSDIPIQRRRTMPVQTSLSDSDSEKTIVDFVSALAANAQFTLFTLHEKDEDQGWVSESSGDGTLVASEAFSTHLS
ncbi:hypothetical protein H0H87_007377 [Tephrocybe sp. NHM501043]|nr:hypothetical protein H0H87_007377 [Tephrocybe sp. NHM501043]